VILYKIYEENVYILLFLIYHFYRIISYLYKNILKEIYKAQLKKLHELIKKLFRNFLPHEGICVIIKIHFYNSVENTDASK
jgi:hypothetical protein